MAQPNASTARSSKPQEPRELSASYRALADVTRLRILHCLWNTPSESGVTVTDMCEFLRVSQPLMSWHLRILRRAGLVTTHRSGRQVYCSIDRTVAEDFGTLLARYLHGAGGEEIVGAIEPHPRLREPIPRVQGAG